MKKLSMLISFLFISGISSSVWATDTYTTTPSGDVTSTTPGVTTTGNPCHNILEACKAAGYSRTSHEPGKKLVRNCFLPILGGKTLSDVTVNADDIQACKAKRMGKR